MWYNLKQLKTGFNANVDWDSLHSASQVPQLTWGSGNLTSTVRSACEDKKSEIESSTMAGSEIFHFPRLWSCWSQACQCRRRNHINIFNTIFINIAVRIGVFDLIFDYQYIVYQNVFSIYWAPRNMYIWIRIWWHSHWKEECISCIGWDGQPIVGFLRDLLWQHCV